MNVTIVQAQMNYDKEAGYSGRVELIVEGHKCPYELTLHSLKGNEWSYGLHFLHEPGSEEEIFEIDEYIEDHDELFERLVEAARKTCNNDPRLNSDNRTQLY